MITPVGSPFTVWYPYNPGATTLQVNPTAVGDLLIAVTTIGDSHGAHATALSGGGVTTWQQLGPSMRGTYSTVALWMGVVTTAGPSTITATLTAGSVVNMYAAQQFTGATTWAVDRVGTKVNTNSTVMTWPTLVPGSSDEMYVGVGDTTAYAPSPGTQTAGYVLPPTYGILLYDPDVNGSQSPTATMLAKANTWTIGALIIAE